MTSTSRIITILLLTLLLSAAAAFTVPAAAETRWALVIGLGSQLDPAWGKINGDRDVPAVRAMLKDNGFTDITELINSAATHDAIIAAFVDLERRAEVGDAVYIHFSGHGQLITDTDGDEDDGLDQAWIPYDAFRSYSPTYHGEKHLVDDEIGLWLSRIRAKVGPEALIAVVVDACHSGGSTRADSAADGDDAFRGVDDDFIIPCPVPARRQPEPEQWLTVSACTRYQTNQEYRGMGKLTYIITTFWREYADMDNDALLSAIAATMDRREYRRRNKQTPEFSGDDTNLFSEIFKIR